MTSPKAHVFLLQSDGKAKHLPLFPGPLRLSDLPALEKMVQQPELEADRQSVPKLSSEMAQRIMEVSNLSGKCAAAA
jgi:hypothetical protein